MRYLLAFAIVTAGCLADPATPDSPAAGVAQPAGSGMGVAELLLGQCLVASGVSVYDQSMYAPAGPPPPFELADIAEEMGNPRIGSQGPITGPASGNWHVTLVCAEHEFADATGPLGWGWIGVAVLPPPWDDGGADRHFVVADLSMPSGPILDWLQELGLHATETQEAVTEWLPGGILHARLDDHHHGVYETHSAVRPAAAPAPGISRFWLLVDESGNGTAFRPTALDLEIRETGSRWLSPDGSAWFSHTRTQNHWPLPGLAGNLVAVAEEVPAAALRAGPVANRTLEQTWLH